MSPILSLSPYTGIVSKDSLSSYESIATVTGTGSSATISFTSIPQTYTHLQIRAILKNADTTGNADNIYLKFNSDGTLTNYKSHYVRTITDNAPTVSTGTSIGINHQGANLGVSGLSNTFGAVIWDILDYTNTNKLKTVRSIGGVDQNGSGAYNTGLGLFSGVWLTDSSAITRIDITCGANWVTGSHFALYGLKG